MLHTSSSANNLAPQVPELDLVQKYNVPGPRYTSYPTAVEFSDSVSPSDYLYAFANSSREPVPLSLYVHLPFCRDICYYCGCNKIVTRKPGVADEYIDYLEKEIHILEFGHNKAQPVTQLHWGGGTPTYLNQTQISRLMKTLASSFNLTEDKNREYAIEVDPRTASVDTLKLLWDLGFNRLSLGIQDFDPRVQQAINREQSIKLVEDLVEGARVIGFGSISFDLIYGLPHQTALTFQSTLDQVIRLAPDRIACYSYAHLPERFPSQRAIDRLTIPSSEQRLEILRCTSQTLMAAGYQHIGMDHYVLPHDALSQAVSTGHLKRNFQGYSVHKADRLVGLGVSAISSNAHYYAQNARDLNSYYQLLDDEQVPVTRGLELAYEDKLRRSVIMALICDLYLDFAAIEAEFDINFTDFFAKELVQMRNFSADGLLTLAEDSISVTPLGRFFVRNICMPFDQYLKEGQRFSKTI